AVRYPRGKGPGVAIEKQMTALPIGRADIRRRGTSIALLAFGSLVAPAQQVADNLDATLVNMRFVKPLDSALILELAKSHDWLITLEENAVAGGAGSAVNEVLANQGVVINTLNLGLPDSFIEHGSREQLLADCGLDAAGIEASIRARLAAFDCARPASRLIS
ncbi:MAG: 1-deoxy-D-xylulose-5-phosphate synthase, partial [Gammaproteobacteria bacterium]|nr:1-deoxy-D-xylulose-5-phosphate synthase [Gammaproteobacteria bacterium]